MSARSAPLVSPFTNLNDAYEPEGGDPVSLRRSGTMNTTSFAGKMRTTSPSAS